MDIIKATHSKEPLLQSLERAIDSKLSKAMATKLKLFAGLYFSGVARDEIGSYSEQHIYSLTKEAWDFIYDRNSSRPQIEFREQERIGSSSTTNIYLLLNDIPFVVDSVRQCLHRTGASIQYVNNTVVHVKRSQLKSGQRAVKTGKLSSIASSTQTGLHAEALLCIHCEHIDSSQQNELEISLRDTLKHVLTAVKDFKKMFNNAAQVNQNLRDDYHQLPVNKEQRNDSIEFIDWLMDNHFTFLGYEKYKVKRSTKGPELILQKNSVLGTSRFKDDLQERVLISKLPKVVSEVILKKQIYQFAKSRAYSKVHRPTYCDYVIIKEFDKAGEVETEHRFLGLYTSSVYYRAALDIPIVRAKVEWVLGKSGYSKNGHSYKDLLQVINTLPRDELFQLTRQQLFDTAIEVTQIQETRTSKLFIRKSSYGNFFSCLVYVPRDIYDTQVRSSIQEFLVNNLHAESAEFSTSFSESSFARIHFTLRVPDIQPVSYKRKQLESRMVELIKPWGDQFMEVLRSELPDKQARSTFTAYRDCFSQTYTETYDAATALRDLQHIRKVAESHSLSLSISSCHSEVGAEFSFKIFSFKQQLFLSKVAPVLENLGLGIISETAFELIPEPGNQVWLHDFSLYRKNTATALADSFRERFEDAFLAAWNELTDDDTFNSLVVTASLKWRDVALLRAYAAYMKQIQFGFSASYIADTLTEHQSITRKLVALFYAQFEPGSTNSTSNQLSRTLNTLIDGIDNLSEDSVLRAFHELISATIRTNFFQTESSGELKQYFSFKLEPQKLSNLPQPKPAFEIFVFSRNMEGVHLRFGKVARGGLRWSDRHEDYRTEILGLAKAQKVKNSVIVPVGAKGGFVMKNREKSLDRNDFMRQGIECYKTFIRGMLDITDNVINGKIISPVDVICRDDNDPYLVVAADKGTATFSDIANSIADDYNFWLGDGFASGGSYGYDHKKMGITAKGAWVSVQRHFREENVDIQKENFSVIGVGDMSGDVFGNGMLLSRHICLLAAFNHLDIFIDPAPDPGPSFKERQRLFNKSRSSWSDYKTGIISAGGGIYSRKAKSITITEHMKKVFAIEADKLSPDQLINCLLKAPVDLIWNGGIGTYAKSRTESHAQAGDKTNDSLRVDGAELRTKIIGEGGNLGLTQAARVEYALSGGVSLTDFIDNSAGVDCSDHEVNIKILLNRIVNEGKMTTQSRNKLLESMEEEVSELVLLNNYSQVQAIGLAFGQMELRNREYADLISYLESSANLDRSLESLPSEEEIEERASKQAYLTRPEISVVTSYMKMLLKSELELASYIDHDYLLPFLYSTFPSALHKKYSTQIKDHPLRRQIIATQVANYVVNSLGPSFIYRMIDSTGATVCESVKAAVIAMELYDIQNSLSAIQSLDFTVESNLQTEMHGEFIKLTRRTGRWLLRNRRHSLDFEDAGGSFLKSIKHGTKLISSKLPAQLLDILGEKTQRLIQQKVPAELATQVASCDFLIPIIGLVDTAEQSGRPLGHVLDVYYMLGEQLQLAWLTHMINQLPVTNHWQALARVSFQDDLTWQRRALTLNIVNTGTNQHPAKQVGKWLEQHAEPLAATKKILAQVQTEPNVDYSMFSVILRELLNLAQKTHLTSKK